MAKIFGQTTERAGRPMVAVRNLLIDAFDGISGYGAIVATHQGTSGMTHKDRTTLDYLRPGTEERVRAREGFRLTDVDGNKQITYSEFATFMADLDPDMSAAELRIGFDEIDSDHDGAISFDEFRSWLAS